jgi:polyisoprenoid-binding protein YceI
MNGRILRTGALLAVMVATAGAARALATLSVQAGSRVWVEGTSTVRGYRCESTRVAGTASMESAAADVAAVTATVRGGEVSVPVASLDCRNGTMNGHLQRALKAAEAPTLRFRMTAAEAGANGAVTLVGELGIAGQERPVRVPATVTQAEGGQLRVAGRLPLRMTDYGVKPPTLMLGTMRVHDPVTVHFDVLLR